MNDDFKKLEKDSEESERIKRYTEIVEDLFIDNCRNHDDYVDFMNSMIHILSLTIAWHLVKEPESKMLSSFNEEVGIKILKKWRDGKNE